MAVNKRKLLASAQRHVQKGSLDKALKDYVRLLEADPRDANVRLKVGDLQLRRNQPKEAIDAYLKVADQFMRDGFDAKAVAIYKQVTKIDGKRYEVYLPLAELYQRLGLVSEAMAALQSAADGYQQEGKRRDALDLLRKMSSLDPSNVPSRLKVADLLAKEELRDDAINEYDAIITEAERQGDWETQIAVFERIVEVDPSRIEAAQGFTQLLLERNQNEQAEHVARKCVEADGDRAESNELLAEVLSSLGKHGEAVEFFKKAAAAWRELGDEAKARDLMQRHVSDDAIDFGAGDLRNEDTGGKGSPFGEASLETDVSFEDPPTRGIGDLADPDAVMDLGFDADSNSESASAEELEELVPEPVDDDGVGVDSEQLLAEASVYVRYGKHEKAIEAIQQVLQHEPANAIAFEQMGDTLAAAGHEAPAVEAWVKAAKLLSPDTDADRIESLRARVAARNEQAAAEVSASPAAEPISAVPEPPDPPPAAAPEPPPEPEPEIELVAPIDADEPAAEVEAPPAASVEDAAAPQPEAAVVQSEAPAAAAESEELELDIELDIDVEDADETDAAAASASAGGASTSTSEQIAEELAEADACFERSRFDEAEAIYRRILDLAPNHPAVQLRLGEIADARAAQASAEADAPSEDAAPATEVSPDDSSLDLESDIDLEAALAAAADAVDPSAPDAGDEEEASSVGDGPAVEIEFGPGDDPDVSFAGLDTAPSPPAEDPDAAALEFSDDLDFEDDVVLDDESAASLDLDPQPAETEEEDIEIEDTEPSVATSDPAAFEAPPVEPTAAAPAAPASPEPVLAPEPPVESAVDVAPAEPTMAEPAPPALEAPVSTLAEEPVAEATAAEPVAEATAAEPVAEAIVAEPEAAEDDVAETAVADVVVEDDEDAVAAENDLPSVATPVVPPQSAEHSADEGPISFDVGEFDPDESFDLAAELSDALSDDPETSVSGIARDEQTGSLETLFSEFKRGVEQTLGDGDIETHFDLGIAYREMGLFEDAIGEFQYALGGESRRLDALHMMALCALELGRPADATAHLEQALSNAEWPENREAPLRYDLGRAYVAVGDPARALDTFRRVAEIDAEFGDVTQLIASLEREGDDNDAGAGDGQETYESFDDLIEAAQSEDGGDEEEDGSAMESFEEFQDFDADDDSDAPSEIGDDDTGSDTATRRRRKVSFI